ncbi:MAG TPA: flavodoxin-dependent (E)-4-hydroxy-3-methylbut-2-enyl-diphosphate synthase [Clostridia bacterium]|nr:flavodoxin-dependent (E)-4-hydroxy-3-methylbut-2-enyl-diphosphate synthase [Clostridia bacterium]
MRHKEVQGAWDDVPRRTIQVMVGNVPVGGGAPISVQTMTKVDTRDVPSVLREIERVREAGADMVRVAVRDREAARAVEEIKRKADIPIIADVHYDYRLAVESLERGADKVRVNPGNIGGTSRLQEVARVAKRLGRALRVGVNSGSLERDVLEEYGGPSVQAMVKSLGRHVRALEDIGFHDIVLSLKSSDVRTTIEAYRKASLEYPYPLHVGVTEAGPLRVGLVKSAIGIGVLLLEGIGDTIRVSLTGDPVEEVKAGRLILQALNLSGPAIDIISCPTCGRCQVDLVGIVRDFEAEAERLEASLREDPSGRGGRGPGTVRVALMGCEVNGPGEASGADVGLAFGRNKAALFKKGQLVKTVNYDEALKTLIEEIEGILA